MKYARGRGDIRISRSGKKVATARVRLADCLFPNSNYRTYLRRGLIARELTRIERFRSCAQHTVTWVDPQRKLYHEVMKNRHGLEYCGYLYRIRYNSLLTFTRPSCKRISRSRAMCVYTFVCNACWLFRRSRLLKIINSYIERESLTNLNNISILEF